jgi:hypothetical protein
MIIGVFGEDETFMSLIVERFRTAQQQTKRFSSRKVL